MNVRTFLVTPITAADGSATYYTPAFSGEIRSIQYVKHATLNYTDGVDFTITGERYGIGIWTESNVNASAVKSPSLATHDQVGVASLYAAGGEPVERPIALANDRVKIVIAAGGDTKQGNFIITVV